VRIHDRTLVKAGAAAVRRVVAFATLGKKGDDGTKKNCEKEGGANANTGDDGEGDVGIADVALSDGEGDKVWKHKKP
jgi:hypothetical protein